MDLHETLSKLDVSKRIRNFDCVWRTVTCDPKSCNYSFFKIKIANQSCLLACLFVCFSIPQSIFTLIAVLCSSTESLQNFPSKGDHLL